MYVSESVRVQLDAGLLARPHVAVQEIHPDMGALPQAVADTEHVAGAGEHVAQLIGPVGRRVEHVAGEHLVDHGEGREHVVLGVGLGDLREDLGRELGDGG